MTVTLYLKIILANFNKNDTYSEDQSFLKMNVSSLLNIIFA